MEIKLNILPEERKREIAVSNRLWMILQWEVGFAIILVVFLLLFLSMYSLLTLNLNARQSAMINGNGKAEFEKIAKFNNDFKAANTQITTGESIQKDQLYWSNLFLKLNAAVPEGVSVVKVATKEYQVLLVGIAKTRDDLILMKDNFSKETCFTDINLPLSSLVSKDNIDFQIQFNIKEECVKNK